jgi:ketosteroid isomerase-like protein
VISYVEASIFIVERFTKLERSLMTPKEIVMGGYQSFADGDMEGLGKIYHKDALIRVNGNHELSGEYRGFDDFLANFLAQIPIRFPNFNLDILNVTAEDDRVHVRLHLTADNLDAESMHCFVVKEGLETEFDIFDDSQKVAAALNG